MMGGRAKSTKKNGECPLCGNPLMVKNDSGNLSHHCGICGWEGSSVTSSGLSDLENSYED